jgi:hypothetical protein
LSTKKQKNFLDMGLGCATPDYFVAIRAILPLELFIMSTNFIAYRVELIARRNVAVQGVCCLR